MTALSKLAASILQSEIRIMSVECAKVGGINLAQGVCDTELPAPVRAGAIAAIESGLNSYTRLDGIGELRQAIATKLRCDNGISVDAEREVVVTVGSTGAFYSSCVALLDPGDEVIVFEPYYGYHVNTLALVQAKPAYVKLAPPGWTFSRVDLERVITPKTRAIVVNTPANPTGKVFTREELGWIAELAVKHDLFVFTDEIYEYFLYDGREHISPATLPGMAERTVTISGFSKTFSITGWRIGYAACSARWAPAIGYFHDLAYVCAPAPLQAGVAAGLRELKPDFYAVLGVEYAAKRKLICDTLTAIGLTPFVPQGAYYVLADASLLPGNGSKEKAMHLLHSAGVASVPGKSFYSDGGGEQMLRFCFAKTDADLAEACRRLEDAHVRTAVGR
ncbi:MAG: pyridoxal phosphate-dependent aminotransferase [Acidobacteriota bacterium]|nr:pyridoxal phosphate-dependent aminotransferase [Acidobacteriota bacterium]